MVISDGMEDLTCRWSHVVHGKVSLIHLRQQPMLQALQCDGVSNHRRPDSDSLLSRLFRSRSKKNSKLRVTSLCEGSHRWPVNSSHKGLVTWKMFPSDDVWPYLYPRQQDNRQIICIPTTPGLELGAKTLTNQITTEKLLMCPCRKSPGINCQINSIPYMFRYYKLAVRQWNKISVALPSSEIINACQTSRLWYRVCWHYNFKGCLDHICSTDDGWAVPRT